MTTFYAPQFTHVTRAFLDCRRVQYVLCWQLYLDTESGSQKCSVGSHTACPCTGVVPVSYGDSHWDTSLAEAKFRLVFIPDGRPRKY